MADPFNNLKNSMKKTLFKNLSFPEERKKAVKESIQGNQFHTKLNNWDEETIIAILKSIQYEEKHGFEISTDLFHQSEMIFQKNEGHLYTLLHFLESKAVITSTWKDKKKIYALTSRGKKLVLANEQKGRSQYQSLKHLLEETSL